MVKHLFLRSWSYVTPVGHWQGKVESVSGPCRNVRVTELCEVKGDVTKPGQKGQQHGHTPLPICRPADTCKTRVRRKRSQPDKKMVGTIPAQVEEENWHAPFNNTSAEKSPTSSILRIPTKAQTLLRNKTSMTWMNTPLDGSVGRLKRVFLGKKKEIEDSMRWRLIWSMDYIYTKPNKQLFIDILMSLYSSFYPAEYAEDVTGSDASLIWIDIDNRVPSISPKIGTRKPTKWYSKWVKKRSKISVFISVGTRFGTRKHPILAHVCQIPLVTNWFSKPHYFPNSFNGKCHIFCIGK